MINHEPHFDQRATRAALGNEIAGPPKLDIDYFKRLLEYGRRVKWGRDEIAPATTDAATDRVHEYFEVFLAERTNQHLLPDLRRLSARFSILVKDQPEPPWLLDIQDGVLTSISRDGMPPACSFALDSVTFLEIAAGQLPPKQAFFTGRIRITGNVELGLKVATVLAKFFSQYPFVAESNGCHA
jgi:predicted lipid carrier protein YhbT